MAPTPDVIDRCGDLKVRLLDFATGRRLRRAYQTVLAERFGTAGPRSDDELIDVLDAFVLQHRLADGRTVVEHFVERHPLLTAEERAILLGWRDVVEGIFVVQGHAGDAVVLENLIDDLTYRVYSNMGPAVIAPDQMPVESFLYSRLVPLGEDWLLSGRQLVYGAERRAELHFAAAEMALRAPRLVFRNPERLDQGWELQRREHQDFIAFFGADVVVVPGAEVPARMRGYMRYLLHERRDDDGRTAAERSLETHGMVPEPLEAELPDDLIASETVGIIYDELDGLNLFPDFGIVAETFAEPELAADPDHADTVRSYLEHPGIIPLPLRRLAERNPEGASRVFRQVLSRPRFSWARDGERLLRRHKPEYYAEPVLPSVTPVGDRLAQARMAGPVPTGPTRGGGRNTPRQGGKRTKRPRRRGR